MDAATLSLPRLIVPLGEATDLAISDVGGKVANLAAMSRAGFPVPDGFVMTTEAFTRFVDSHGFGPGTSPAEVRSAALLPDMVEELRRALEQLPGPVAVRSSGVVEDLVQASYAGQYETVLGVEGLERVVDAVRHCWASAFEDRLARYHQARDGDGVPALAVLIQLMVAADSAGVAFSVNPVTGDRGEIVINAVRGLGNRLVAGEVDAEHWSVRGPHAQLVSGAGVALAASQALLVAGFARRLHEHFAGPQDIEWAITGDEVHLLQSRPITTLPAPTLEVTAEIPAGYWEREVSHAPRQLTPFGAFHFLKNITESSRLALAEFGILLDATEFREIGGWMYVRLVPVGGQDRPAPPAWLMPLIIRLVPSIRRRIRRSQEAMRADRAMQLIERWREEWQSELASRIVSLRSVDLAGLSDERLREQFTGAVRLLEDGSRIHLLLHAAISFPLAELAFSSHELLGYEEPKTWELLSGLSRMSTEPARRLAELTSLAAANPALRNAVEHWGPDVERRLETIDPEFALAFRAYQEEHGCRALNYDVADGTLAEMPGFTLGLIRDQLARGFDPAAQDLDLAERRRTTLEEARKALAGRNPAARNRWERALARAQVAYPVREDNEYFTTSAPLALLHYAALEVGERLARRSQVSLRDDVFFLTREEALEAFDDGGSWADLVALRRAERARVEAHPGPPSYGRDPGGPPPLDALPKEARFANEALIWYIGQIMEAKASSQRQSGDEIRGIPASPGRYRGTVRVIRSEDEFGRLEAGDVLVCPITSPVWSVLFTSIGALVTDTGGVLSHPAIIAREYRIPAVVAAGNATQLLRDGQVVIVDGSIGSVQLA